MSKSTKFSYESQIDDMINKGYDIQDITEFLDNKFDSGCITYTTIDKLTDYAEAKLSAKKPK